MRDNDKFVLSYTYLASYNSNSLNYETMTQILDFDMNPLTCQKYTKTNVNLQLEEKQFGTDENSNYYYNVLNKSISVSHYNTSLNMITEYNTKSESITSVIDVDVTDCIWPRYESLMNTCSFPLPIPILESSYSFEVGSSSTISKSFLIVPFEHCQNSKFIVSVIDESTLQEPDWISIDQKTQNITINTNLINHVLSAKLHFSARLFTISEDTNLITSNFTSIFNFTNNNCNLISSNYSYYLASNKIKEMRFIFEDDELDNIKIKIKENLNYGSFVKYEDSTIATIMLQSTFAQEDPVDFSFMYTDSYHQTEEDWREFKSSLYLFLTEPPIFNNSFSIIESNRCADYTLPSVIDQNNEHVVIKLEEGTPDWIKIHNNSILSISSKSGSSVVDGETKITIILENESKSWRKYYVAIIVDPIDTPTFEKIPDFYRNELIGDGVYISINSQKPVNVVHCYSNDLVSWYAFEDSRLKLLSIALILNLLETECIRLSTIDSCNNYVYSNMFYITLKDSNKPPVLLNHIGPFDLPQGKYSLFRIPEDMFYDLSGSKLIYDANVVYCSQDELFKTGIVQDASDAQSTLIYAYCNYTINCKVSVVAINKYNQTSEEIINFRVYRCASKNCIECEGPHQSQCTRCSNSYELKSFGVCLRKEEYFSFDDFNFFKILGIISCFSVGIHLILSIKFGRYFLNNIRNLQIILVFMFSNPYVDENFKDYSINILYIKFDFGFLHSILFDNSNLRCENESDRMADLEFYCQSIVQNYFFLFTLSIIIFVLYILIIRCLNFQSIKHI